MQVSKDKVNNLTNLYKFIQIKTDGKGQIRIIIYDMYLKIWHQTENWTDAFNCQTL